jgi:hypothetical protein
MPFCPRCKYEYRSDVSVCPDCDEPLVANLPPDDDDEPVEDYDWVPIARMTSPQYAEMIVEVLRSKNIPAVVSDSTGHFGQTGQMGTSSFRPIAGAVLALYVPREFAADAGHEAEVILGEDWDKIKMGDF